ncbi:uncharacterized protein LOC134711787 isoform X2 [Mytilus trossulus]|uniref:uncharacterized protein LOC134711787 isoform X2 n=1 Tax=Mytilus trossulus TaxID=6551 RepID=UPI00300604B9
MDITYFLRMQVTSCCVVVFCLVSFIGKINSTTDLNHSVLVINCPKQFRQLIAQQICLNPQTYHCLRVRNNVKQLQFLQTCNYSRTPVPEGEYPIQDKDSGNLNSEICSEGEFQFNSSWSNEQSRCLFEKSLCNEEGQIIYSDENSIRDRRCTCDHTNGYKFTTYPINRHYCVPFDEDCSCYRDMTQEDSYTLDIKIVNECLNYLDMSEEPTKCYQAVKLLYKYKRMTQESQDITSKPEIHDEQTYEKQRNWYIGLLRTIVICIVCFLLMTVLFIWNYECMTALWLRKMFCTEQECSKHMSNKVVNTETPANAENRCHTMTTNEEHPSNESNDLIPESDQGRRMGTRVIAPDTTAISGPSILTSLETSILNHLDENGVNPKKHNAGSSRRLLPRENDEKCLWSNDSKDIHGAEYTASPVRDITVMSVEFDNSVERYIQHLELLNKKYDAGATIEKFPENASKEQQDIILRSSRHIFIYITEDFTIQKFKQVVDFEYLKRKYFADPINIDRVKLIYDNADNIPEELKALNSIPYCTAGNSEIYNNRMQYYFVVRKN